MPIIDSDIHNALTSNDELLPHLSAYWQATLKTNGMPVAGIPYRSPVGVMRSDAATPAGGPPGSDPHHMLNQHFTPNNIAYGILNGSSVLGISLWTDPDFANAVASAYNDALAQRWLAASDKFRGSILVNHSDPPAAAKEIRRVAATASARRFVQIIMASGARTLFGHRSYYPIYEAAAEHNLPVAFHPGTEGAGISGSPTPSGYPSRYFEWHNILPTNYMAHLNSLVCEGAFEKFPTLKIVAVEGGIAWLPHLLWRMDKNWKALRSTTPWLKEPPSHYILKNVRFTTQPIEEPPNPSHLLQIFDMVDAQNTVMFSSDYPHWDNDNPLKILNNLPDPTKQKIFYQNAADLYRLPPL